MEIRNHVYKFDVDKKETGKFIKKLRKERKWSAEDLAEKLYCSSKTISSWETGARLPSLDMLVSMSDLFEVGIHSLLLPLDNCPCKMSEHYHPDMDYGNGTGLPEIWEIDDDETLEEIFLIKEYILQKHAAGLFGERELNELSVVANHFIFDAGQRQRMRIFMKKEGSKYELSELMFYKEISKIEHFFWEWSREENDPNYEDEEVAYIYSLSLLFMKLICNKKFEKTIKAMGVIEKSVLFTTAILCENTRNKEFAKELYYAGAYCVKGVKKKIPEKCIKSAEKVILKDTYDVEKEKYREFSKIMAYINYHIMMVELETIEELLCDSEGMPYDEYIKSLMDKGEIDG